MCCFINVRSLTGHVFSSMLFFSLLFYAALTQAKPFEVGAEVKIRTGDWFPLPTEDMKAAAVDTALAELTKGGLFLISPESESSDSQIDKILLEISLIGPAETAKLTVRVDLKDHATYISTASISVHDMDYQDIYNAFEHIGMVAAQRLNDKTQALLIKPREDLNPVSEPDKKLKALYDEAQKLKRKYQYNKSRILFEQVANADDEASERLAALAQDELKYGLTVFEAKQSVVSMGVMNGKNARVVSKKIQNAENLYRQILAENSDNLMRVQEAQSALDNLSVTRSALKNVSRAQTMMAAHGVKMVLEQAFMMEGECPDKKKLTRLSSRMHTEVDVKSVIKSKLETRYAFTEASTGNPFVLTCGNGRVIVQN